jgi:hypothetical protein
MRMTLKVFTAPAGACRIVRFTRSKPLQTNTLVHRGDQVIKIVPRSGVVAGQLAHQVACKLYVNLVFGQNVVVRQITEVR